MVNQKLIDTFFEIDTLDRDQFLKVRETLTRIGLPARTPEGKQTLWQTCHVLHKQGRYFIVHFKQLFLLDGRSKVTNFTDEDEDRTEFIVNLLESWGLVRSLVEIDSEIEANVLIIPYKDKHRWDLRAKYTLGNSDGSSEEN